jgi:hypothetical protein
MTTLRLIITFYKSYALASWIITLSCMSIILAGGLKTLAALFWFKIITFGVIIYFINMYKRKEFYYYKNLGLSKLLLWISSGAIDLMFFVLLLIIASIIK